MGSFTDVVGSLPQFTNKIKNAFDFESDTAEELMNFAKDQKTTLGKMQNLSTEDLFNMFFGKDAEIGSIQENLISYLSRSAKVLSTYAITEGTTFFSLSPLAGITAGELFSQLIDDITDSYTENSKPDSPYTYGQWVRVDLGHQKKIDQKRLKEEEWMETAEFGDFDDNLTKTVQLSEEDYSLGFYLGEKDGNYMVFVFEYKDTDVVLKDHVRALSQVAEDKINKQFEFVTFRELFLQKREGINFTENIKHKFEIGDEVIFEEKVRRSIAITSLYGRNY